MFNLDFKVAFIIEANKHFYSFWKARFWYTPTTLFIIASYNLYAYSHPSY